VEEDSWFKKHGIKREVVSSLKAFKLSQELYPDNIKCGYWKGRI
jgi:hypothetical protein